MSHIVPADPFPSSRGNLHTLRMLLPYLWTPGLRLRVVGALLCLALAKVVNVYVPVLYKQGVDSLSLDIALMPLGLILAYGGARIASQTFGELRDALFAKVGQRAIRIVALKVFRHLHGLSLRFHLDRQTGGLSRVIERGTTAIDFLLNFALFNILPTLLEILMVCGLLLSMYEASFALVTFLTIVLYIAFTLGVTEWRIHFRREMNAMDQDANTKAIDSLLNYETVKYFANEEHEVRRFDSAQQRYEKAAVSSKTSLSLLNIGQGVIISLGLTAVMALAARGVIDKRMTVGDFVLVNTYLIQLYLPLNFLGFVYREIKQSLIDMEGMFSLLSQPVEVADQENATPLILSAGGNIVFDTVHFGYHADREILKGISFTVPAGRTVAIVGPSGAGKSTLSRLLFRFYDVWSGRILIDGQDIRQVTQNSLRAAIGIVPQDTVLFNDTILYNIGYGRPGASREEIEEAARMARIHDFVMTLPQGYATKVGERGLKLSGGEKQRVAIARTILKSPGILLFDEATSALDSRTERKIQESLREVSSHRTALVIAHRLSTVIDADEILVLDQGKIIERGRHGDLLAQGGAYAAMWAKQQDGNGEESPHVL